MTEQPTNAAADRRPGKASGAGLDPARLVSRETGGLLFTGTITPHDLRTGRLVNETGDLAGQLGGVRVGLMFFDVPEDAVIAQTATLYGNLAAVLSSRGLSLGNVVRQRLFLTDVRDLPAIERTMDLVLDGPLPATSIVVVPNERMDPALRVSIDVIAAADPGWSRVGHAGARPSLPTGRYPDAVRCGELLFVSAINGVPVAVDGSCNETGSAPASSPHLGTRRERRAYAEAIETFRRLTAILEANGSNVASVLKVNGWVRIPMREYGSVVLARNEFFDTSERTMMASTGLQVAGTAAADALLAFDAIALADGTAPKRVTGAASAISSPYVAGAAMGGGLLVTSGEIPVEIADRRVVATATDLTGSGRLLRLGRIDAESGMEARAWQVYTTLERHLQAAGTTFAHTAHQTVFTTDPRLIAELTTVARHFYAGDPPPTTVIPIVSTTPFPTAELEIELVASL